MNIQAVDKGEKKERNEFKSWQKYHNIFPKAYIIYIFFYVLLLLILPFSKQIRKKCSLMFIGQIISTTDYI